MIYFQVAFEIQRTLKVHEEGKMEFESQKWYLEDNAYGATKPVALFLCKKCSNCLYKYLKRRNRLTLIYFQIAFEIQKTLTVQFVDEMLQNIFTLSDDLGLYFKAGPEKHLQRQTLRQNFMFWYESDA